MIMAIGEILGLFGGGIVLGVMLGWAILGD